jgi:DNA end-binding protein Ku
VDAKQLALARQLITSNLAPFHPKDYKNDYETALRELVNAKLKNKPLPKEESKAPRGKVIDLMDALRRSLREKGRPSAQARKSERRGAQRGKRAA